MGQKKNLKKLNLVLPCVYRPAGEVGAIWCCQKKEEEESVGLLGNRPSSRSPPPCRARAFRLPVPLQVHTLSLVLMHSLSSTDSCRADVGVNCSTQHCSSHSGSSNSTKEFKRYTLRSFPIITNPIARDLSFGPAPFFFFFRGDEPISLCYVKTDTGLLIDPIPLIRYSPSGGEGLGT